MPQNQDHCSAFVATGSYSRDGGIVMAHNSWDQFTHGQYMNEILDLQPAEGHRMFMQNMPGLILDGYLKDRPTQPWSLFAAGEQAP